MHRPIAAFLLSSLCMVALGQPTPVGSSKAWVKQSDAFTRLLLDVELEHNPERGSSEGVAKFDERISNPTLADDLAKRRELKAALAKIHTEGANEQDNRVREDLTILNKALDLQFRTEDYALQ